jgi:hypothetical protein
VPRGPYHPPRHKHRRGHRTGHAESRRNLHGRGAQRGGPGL